MEQYIGFKLGAEEFALPILMVQEIVRPSDMIRPPNIPDYVIGLMNLRGKAIPVIDLRKRLSIEGDNSELESKVLVVNIGSVTFGSKVDAIIGVMNIEDSMIENIESKVDVITGETNEYVKGIANVNENRMVLLMDFKKFLNLIDSSLLEDEVLNTKVLDNGKVEVTKKVSTMGGEVIVKEVKDAIKKGANEKGLGDETVNLIMEQVQNLLDSMACGDFEKAEKAVLELSSFSNREIYSELGKITRNLHDSLIEFKKLIDPKLTSVTRDDMPEAADKLQWVMSKTDEAATKVIGIAERNLALQSGLSKSLEVVEKRINKLKKNTKEEKEAIASIKQGFLEMNADFVEIMLAQEFQDITGQILKKVISLVSDMEAQLVSLVRIFGVKGEKQTEEMAGPQIKEAENVLSGQDDVDDLLSDLGF